MHQLPLSLPAQKGVLRSYNWEDGLGRSGGTKAGKRAFVLKQTINLVRFLFIRPDKEAVVVLFSQAFSLGDFHIRLNLGYKRCPVGISFCQTKILSN